MAISDKRKDKLRGKANREARQSANIAIRPFRRDIRKANQEFRNTVKSSERASQMLQGILGQAIKGIKKSGLKGVPKGQLLRELSGQRVDAAKMVPYETNLARDVRSDAIETARGNIADIRAGQALDARTNLKDAIAAVRDRQRQKAEETQTDPRSAAAADFAARNTFQSLVDGAEVDISGLDPELGTAEDKEQIAQVEAAQAELEAIRQGDTAALDRLTAQVAASEGVDIPAAREAVARLVQLRQPQFAAGDAVSRVAAALSAYGR